jgi:signal transduction histidine kinase
MTAGTAEGYRQPSPISKPCMKERLRAALMIVAIWIGVGLFTTQFTYLALHRNGVTTQWLDLFERNLFNVLLWAAFTPAIVWLAWRVFALETPAWRRAVIHVIACLSFAAGDVAIEHAAALVLPVGDLVTVDVITLFLSRLFLNALCYIAVVAIATVIAYARISRERQDAAARLAKQLAEARLQSLEAQLRPHFLFNTLSMIAEQVHRDPNGADRMIGRLSHLLRVSLSVSDGQEVTLAEEIRSLRAYLDIMDVRLSGRVRVTLDVDPEAETVLVPVLILQPVVENAFRHGIEARGRGAEFRVRAGRSGQTLEIEIADNGPGLDTSGVREGIGLRVVRERLAELYGERGGMRLERVGGETITTLRFPLRVLATSGGDADARPILELVG